MSFSNTNMPVVTMGPKYFVKRRKLCPWHYGRRTCCVRPRPKLFSVFYEKALRAFSTHLGPKKILKLQLNTSEKRNLLYLSIYLSSQLASYLDTSEKRDYLFIYLSIMARCRMRENLKRVSYRGYPRCGTAEARIKVFSSEKSEPHFGFQQVPTLRP